MSPCDTLERVAFSLLESLPRMAYAGRCFSWSGLRTEDVPMTIAFVCPNCARQLKFKVEAAGKTARCPRCGGPVQVPKAEPSEATFTPTAATFTPVADELTVFLPEAPSTRRWPRRAALGAAGVF